MRGSDGGHWVHFDKAFKQEFAHIRGREFSRIEAAFSFMLDIDNGSKWSIKGYSQLWGWSRNKVRKFTKDLLSIKGHQRDTRGTQEGHPMHLIFRESSANKDTRGTQEGHQKDTTIKTKTKTKELPPPQKEKKTPLKKKIVYSEGFLKFWKKYPRKENKQNAFKFWDQIDFSNGKFEEIMKALEWQRNQEQWNKEKGKYIPLPSTWLNGARWEDEKQILSISTHGPTGTCNQCQHLFWGDCPGNTTESPACKKWKQGTPT